MPKAAADKVKSALLSHWLKLPPEGAVIIAVSGGVDSMVLLEGLSRICREPERRRRLAVVHVNHGLRAAESDGDEAFVKARCGELSIPVNSFRLTWAGESPSQEACREKRERIFQDLCSEAGDRVLLAHHLNDQAETVLFRLIRGTGAKGLRGILPRAGRKVRPLLSLEKAVLVKAAKHWGISWREDSSNATLDYDRNWLRSLFPLIESRRPGFQAKLAALAEEAQAWKFSSSAPIDSFSCGEGVSFSRPTRQSATLELQEAFRVSRRHSQDLHGLLSRPSGQLHAEGVRFSWSAGILLAERGGSFRPHLSAPLDTGRTLRLEGSLGQWEIPANAGLLDSGAPRGESVKKAFQALKVPVFFRPAVPLMLREGRPTALLPGGKESLGGIRFSPSPLGRWWLRT